MIPPDAVGPGCRECAWEWPASGSGREVLGRSQEHVTEVSRCRVCGTYWEYPMGNYPRRISQRDAERMLA